MVKATHGPQHATPAPGRGTESDPTRADARSGPFASVWRGPRPTVRERCLSSFGEAPPASYRSPVRGPRIVRSAQFSSRRRSRPRGRRGSRNREKAGLWPEHVTATAADGTVDVEIGECQGRDGAEGLSCFRGSGVPTGHWRRGENTRRRCLPGATWETPVAESGRSCSRYFFLPSRSSVISATATSAVMGSTNVDLLPWCLRPDRALGA